MFYGNIFVSHLFRLVLGMDQHIVQILPYEKLTALNFRTLSDRLIYPVYQKLTLYIHLFKQF